MDESMEYTLALIKPDAVRAGKASEIQQLIEMSGFLIIARRQLQLTPRLAEEFYFEHKGKAFINGLIEFMISGPIVAIVLAKCHAIKAWRELMGPTNVLDARLKAPRCMRALYGTDGTRNACHGSDSLTSAEREIRFFFPKLQLATAVVDAEAAKEYIAAKLQPTLVKALTVLAREKPTSNKLDAITFLAHWLLDHNPNKPQTQIPPELRQQVKQQQAEREAAAAAAAAKHAAAVVAARQAGSISGRGTSNGKPAAHAGAPAANKQQLEDEAATKVQAAFRGHRARRQMAGMRATAVTPAAT